MRLLILFLSLLPLSLAQNCQLVVPQNPLTISGLTTPYRLLAPCNQSDPGMSAFVHAVLVDSIKGTIYVYNPLVINDGDPPGAPPVVPANPPFSFLVGIWFGSNANTLTLVDDGTGSLISGNCINGAPNSIFGQFAYCNAPPLFALIDNMIQTGIITVPNLVTANDGQICPTIRDFFVVDMDQSDNVVTTYLVSNGRIFQDTLANRAALNTTAVRILSNASDNRLLSIQLAAALGCPPWMALDMAQPGAMLPALALNEIQAKYRQAPPMANVPLTDPMVRLNGQPSLDKVNIYREGVFQSPALTSADADPYTYCRNMYYTAPQRLLSNAMRFSSLLSPDPTVANSFYAFMTQRFATSFGPDGLNCQTLLQVPSPVTVIRNQAGIAVDAMITPPVAPAPPATTDAKGTAAIVVVVVLCVVAIVVGTLLAYFWEPFQLFVQNRISAFQ